MESAHHNHVSTDNPVSFSGWFIPLIVLIIAISGFLAIVKSCSKEGNEAVVTENQSTQIKSNESGHDMALPADSIHVVGDSTTKTTKE